MKNRLKIAVISYYWPPASSVGVRRWLRFCEILPEHEIVPVVFCPENPDYPIVDPDSTDNHGVEVETVKVPIFEWRRLYRKLMPSGKKRGIKQKNKIDGIFYEDRKQLGFRRKLSLWIRANIVLPDARASWINPCSEALIEYMKKNKVDMIVSTGPPHTCHRIALKVKRQFPDIPWMADFRDPWTGGAYFSLLPLTKWGLRRHQRMEREVLREADQVLTVSWSWAEQFKALGARQVDVITNGYDTQSFDSADDILSHEYIMSHVGTMYGDRNSGPFWEALSQYLDTHPEFAKRFKMKLIGRVGPQIKEWVEKLNLTEYVDFVGVTDHLTAVREMQRSNSLLLIVNNAKDFAGRIPAKVFEYLATTRPILLIGPEKGDIHRIIEEGLFFIPTEETDIEVLKTRLGEIFTSDFIRAKGIEKYERGELTRNLVELIREAVQS